MNTRSVRLAIATSFISLAVTLVVQLITPRVLLRAWSEQGYAFTIAIQGFTSYISIADAGVQAVLSRTLLADNDRGDDDLFGARARAGARALGALAASATIVTLIAASVLVSSRLTRLGGGNEPTFLTFAIVATGVGAAVALGGWSTAIECGRGYFARTQGFTAMRIALGGLSMPLMAALGASPSKALISTSILTTSFDFVRALLATRLLPNKGATQISAMHLAWTSRGSFLYSVAGPTQVSLQPAVAALANASSVAAAVPARTLANAAKLLSTAVTNSIWVALSRDFSDNHVSDQTANRWKTISLRLTTLHLAATTALLVLGPLILPLWLGPHAPNAARVLPLFLTEQAALAAIGPSILLWHARGEFGQLARIQILGAIVAVIATPFAAQRYGGFGVGAASAIALVTITVPMLLFRESQFWSAMKLSPMVMMGPRTFGAASIALCAFLSVVYPAAVWCALVGFAVLLAASWRQLVARNVRQSP